MVPEMEKPIVTEIRVRMDCNGCVQKIKKALHGVTGISDMYIDLAQQKVTIIGWADPAKIVEAIKKTRKTVVVCSHPEPPGEAAEPGQEPEPEPESEPEQEHEQPPEPESEPESSTTPSELRRMDTVPSSDGQKEEVLPSQLDNPPPEVTPSTESANVTRSQSTHRSKPQEEIHVMYHHPPDYASGYGHYQGAGRQWSPYQNGPQFIADPSHPPQPVHVTHSYNAYKPSPYVTEYAYPSRPLPPPPPPAYSGYNIPEQYSQVYYSGSQIRGEPSQTPQPVHYYSRQSDAYPGGQHIRAEPPSQLPQPIQGTQSYYNTYRPSPYATTEYAYPQSPNGYSHYNSTDNYSEVYYSGNNGSASSNGNITSMFSEENPNACSIV